MRVSVTLTPAERELFLECIGLDEPNELDPDFSIEATRVADLNAVYQRILLRLYAAVRRGELSDRRYRTVEA